MDAAAYCWIPSDFEQVNQHNVAKRSETAAGAVVFGYSSNDAAAAVVVVEGSCVFVVAVEDEDEIAGE